MSSAPQDFELGSTWSGWSVDLTEQLVGSTLTPPLYQLLRLVAWVQDQQDQGHNVYATIGRGRSGAKALVTINVDGVARYASGFDFRELGIAVQQALDSPQESRRR